MSTKIYSSEYYISKLTIDTLTSGRVRTSALIKCLQGVKNAHASFNQSKEYDGLEFISDKLYNSKSKPFIMKHYLFCSIRECYENLNKNDGSPECDKSFANIRTASSRRGDSQEVNRKCIFTAFRSITLRANRPVIFKNTLLTNVSKVFQVGFKGVIA
jgi:hypothetical protein